MNKNLSSNKKQFDKTSLNFQLRESYKTARTNIGFSIIKDGCKKVIVSSSLQGEGKTTTSVNLAITFSQQVETKVLIIDCDLRKPKIDRYFEISSVPGLTNVISKEVELSEVIRKTKTNNLDVICSGAIPPNPSELLASKYMKNILDELEKQYDYIILDTPPINLVSDALVLLKNSDGIVIVIKDGESTYPEYNRTIELLNRADAKILGVIVNGTKMNKKSKYSRVYKYDY